MCVWMTKKLWSRWQRLQQSPRQLADLTCVLLTDCWLSRNILLLSDLQRLTGVRASLTHLKIHVQQGQCWMHFNGPFYWLLKGHQQIFYDSEMKRREILLQKKRLKCVSIDTCQVSLFWQGLLHIYVFDQVCSLWIKQQKKLDVVSALSCLSYWWSCWSFDNTRLQVCWCN